MKTLSRVMLLGAVLAAVLVFLPQRAEARRWYRAYYGPAYYEPAPRAVYRPAARRWAYRPYVYSYPAGYYYSTWGPSYYYYGW